MIKHGCNMNSLRIYARKKYRATSIIFCPYPFLQYPMQKLLISVGHALETQNLMENHVFESHYV